LAAPISSTDCSFLSSPSSSSISSFSLTASAPTALSPLSLHDALPICPATDHRSPPALRPARYPYSSRPPPHFSGLLPMPICCWRDRKSTRLNSSHVSISYAVFCLKKKRCEHMISPINQYREAHSQDRG